MIDGFAMRPPCGRRPGRRLVGLVCAIAAGTGLGIATTASVAQATEIVGLRVGPVWFAERPDRALHAFMASMMDRPVEGAIGGSAFRYLKMTIDYPGAVASFELPAAKS